MRRIAQISDLHFGAHDPAVVAALHDALTTLRPDLVVVSGDLTQRARTRQFVEADAFLAGLEAAGLRLLVVPGNHDVRALDRPLARLLWPLRRYRRLVARDRDTFVADAEMAVLGLTTAHGLTVKDGRLTTAQVRRIGDAFADTPREATRILVTHHPLVALPRRDAVEPAARGARRALAAVADADVRLVLAGHHHAHTVVLHGAALSFDRRVLVVQAGTATSWRTRGVPNGFNLIDLDGRHATIAEWTADGGPFAPAAAVTYAGDAPDGGWSRRL